jgi:hypothetical protein
MQPLGRIAQFGRIFRLNPGAHMQAEGFIFQPVQILGFAWVNHFLSLP